jgi:hypothetical protein
VLTLGETAARLGRLRWLELRVYEVMGGWVASTREPEAKVLLAEQCYHHAWHADVWGERFPSGYGLELDEATGPGGPALAGALDRIAALASTADRLTALYQVVLPRKIVAYREWRERANPVSDAALVRWLQLVLSDEVEDWQRGEVLLQRLLASTASVERAARVRSEVERSVAEGGGFLANLRNL